jgi:O-antigen/teichoic acid export membrane protein
MATQLDVLLFGVFLSHYGVGIYQAGARLIQVISPFAIVLSTVFLPIISNAYARKDDAAVRSTGNRVMLEFNVLAVLGAGAFAVLGPLMTSIIYGSKYAELTPLWAGFAMTVILRFGAAGFRVPLIAMEQTAVRIRGQVYSMVVLTLASWLLIPNYGLRATSLLLALSSLPNHVLMAWAAQRSGRFGRMPAVQCGAVIVSGGLLCTASWLYMRLS